MTKYAAKQFIEELYETTVYNVVDTGKGWLCVTATKSYSLPKGDK